MQNTPSDRKSYGFNQARPEGRLVADLIREAEKEGRPDPRPEPRKPRR